MAEIVLNNGRVISDYGKPYIIAELGSNHNGDMKIARDLILRAKECGADCVKFQSWSKETIFSRKVYDDNYFLADDYRNRTDYTLEEIVEEFSISEKELLDMAQICKEVGIDFSSSPFSKREVDFLVDECHAPFVKIASMDLNNYPFLDYVAKKGAPVVLATGLSELWEVAKAVKMIEDAGNNQIILLHCISVYPPRFEDINLNNIIGLRSMFPDYPIGFSDHSIGVEIPAAAAALGSCIIEKHFTLDKDMFGWDHKISADPSELKELVDSADHIYKALGSTKRVVNNDEIKKRDAFRRSIVAAGNLKAGDVITYDDIDFKRPGTGITPGEVQNIVGRTLKRDVAFDQMISLEDLV